MVRLASGHPGHNYCSRVLRESVERSKVVPMSEQDPQVQPDTVSDPANDDEVGSDWSGEGGATPEGPATDEDADDSFPDKD